MTRPLVTVKTLIAQTRQRGAVELPENALVTPAARDWLSGTRVAVRRVNAPPEQAAAPERYFLGDAAQPVVQTLVPGLHRRHAGLKFVPCHGNMAGLLAALRETCAALSAAPERRAVVVVREGASISCVANKYPRVRAAILGQPSDLLMLLRELGVNLLILERERTSLQQMRAAIDSFFTGPCSVAPVIEAALAGLALAAQPGGLEACGCKK